MSRSALRVSAGISAPKFDRCWNTTQTKETTGRRLLMLASSSSTPSKTLYAAPTLRLRQPSSARDEDAAAMRKHAYARG